MQGPLNKDRLLRKGILTSGRGRNTQKNGHNIGEKISNTPAAAPTYERLQAASGRTRVENGLKETHVC